MKEVKKINENVIRYQPDIHHGLTNEQVKERINSNFVNEDNLVPTKSIGNIIRDNLFTLFNFLNLGLGLAIFLVGSYKNLLFLGVVICNTIISVIQEIRSKITIDKMSLIAATKVKVLRHGVNKSIKINEIVLDDILDLSLGNQVVVDGIIVSGSCEINEAFITGEAEPVYKKKGDIIYSGSFVVSGKCLAKVEHIGADNYTSSISMGARYKKKLNSELMASLNKIIKFLSLVIVPIGTILLWRQAQIPDNTLETATVNTVAALIGMIPEGLILLTSTVLAISVMRLSKYSVLVQELYGIETLARVDTLCIDKTGTITDGKMEVIDLVPLTLDITNYSEILSALTSNLDDNNATIEALQRKYKEEVKWIVKEKLPFSSSRKLSGITFDTYGTYIMGAPEFVLGSNIKDIEEKVNEYTKQYRVLLLGYSDYDITNELVPANIKPVCLILLRDKIRHEASKTLKYFGEQGLKIKILSGDNVFTVANIASRVGLDIKDNYFDLSTIEDDEALHNVIANYDIFGRVTPHQKQTIIKLLKRDGHTVAMVGDGVNDVLALKEADCSIALASGSEAARNISQLVLLKSNFEALPMVVAEGRRTINNISRSATLFLVKTIYASLLAVIFIFLHMLYPFIPIHLTLNSALTIGIPSLILAIEPNKERIKGNFLTNVISRALPAGLSIVINIIIIMIITYIFNLSSEQSSTLSVIITSYIGFMLLYKLCVPLNRLRLALLVTMISIFIFSIIGLKELFSLAVLSPYMLIAIVILIIFSTYLFNWLTDLYHKIRRKHRKWFR